MSVLEPKSYGLIFRKGPRTRTALRALQEEVAPVLYQDDEHLVATCLGASPARLDQWLERFDSAGLVRGQDFVVTANQAAIGAGVQGPVPDWLEVCLSPTGNPPELEARMEPDVREMWERTCRRVYSLKTTNRT